ncbi:Soluble epoxide hydrolase [Brevundimonas vesicularis]|uniref:Soluble epoxide hydrolase n=1 Tax=Brevundimonas vesicularis TaxID=41276 RepID=A0A2X1BEF8_BREVE|nr:alpha/beta hydrolase [Brevundimonas vesicularis]SPU54810.1 Soluble epoxide hydrolase [Brevundimonas vesicularis]
MTWEEFATVRVDVGDAKLAVRIGGSGPPIVLLHGFPQHSLMWHTVAPLLAERFTVIAPDQRGMGASTVAEGNYTKTALAGDLAKVLDALGHAQAHVAGYDLGAGVAVAFARDHPQRVGRLAVLEFVLAGFGLERAMAPKPGWNADSNWHFSVFAVPDVAVWLFAGRERELLEWFFWHESHTGSLVVSEAHIEAYARSLSRPGVLRAGAGYYASIFQDAIDNGPLKTTPLAMPVLAVGGAAHAGPVLTQFWSDVATDLTTAVIPAAGHWLSDENPRATATALADFFSQS